MIVRLRPQASVDIAEVWEHIAEDNLAAADRWVDQLGEQFRLLATQPLMGRERNELSPRLRSFPYGRYVIFYEPLNGGVEVVRLLHSARDVDPMFGTSNA